MANNQLIVEPIEINLYPNQSRYHIDLSLYCQSLSVPNSTLLSYSLPVGTPSDFAIYVAEYPYILIYVPSDSTTLQTITLTYSVSDGTYTETNDITLHCGSTGFLENGHDLAVMYKRI